MTVGATPMWNIDGNRSCHVTSCRAPPRDENENVICRHRVWRWITNKLTELQSPAPSGLSRGTRCRRIRLAMLHTVLLVTLVVDRETRNLYSAVTSHRICCEEGQSWRLCHVALTPNFNFNFTYGFDQRG